MLYGEGRNTMGPPSWPQKATAEGRRSRLSDSTAAATYASLKSQKDRLKFWAASLFASCHQPVQ